MRLQRGPPRGRLDDRDVAGRTSTSVRGDACARSPEQLGGTYADNPLWWAKRVITVHPLGGAPMGRTPRRGRRATSTARCSATRASTSSTASLLPGPVGANPSLTIAAIADRACTHLLDDWHRSLVEEVAQRPSRDRRPRRRRQPPRVSRQAPARRRPGRAVASGAAAEVHRADEGLRRPGRGRPDGRARPGQGRPRQADVRADHQRRRRGPRSSPSPATRARRSASSSADVLGGRLEVERGWFNLFVDGRRPRPAARCSTGCG